MSYRRSAVLAAAAACALLVPMLAATPASSARPQPAKTSGDGWCASPTAAPCIVAVSRDTTPVVDGDPNWSVTAASTSGNGAHSMQWFVSSPSSTVSDPTTASSYASLPAAETGHDWSITLRVPFQPRATDGYGDNLAISRATNKDRTHNVTITGNPVTMGVNDECHVSSWPWTCPATSGANVTTFQGDISDFEQWSDSSQWADFNGLDIWTNIEESDTPPQITGDPLTIKVDLANSHTLVGAGSPFHGFFHMVIPNLFLQDMGIDDPATLDPAGISTSIGAGAVVVTPGAQSTRVDATAITFSPRTLKIKRGTITPTRVVIARASRSTHRVRIAFHRAKPRGSRITGYQARCFAKHHPTRTATGKHSALVVKGLAGGVRYTCEVRARAKAGYGRWSKPRHIKA